MDYRDEIQVWTLNLLEITHKENYIKHYNLKRRVWETTSVKILLLHTDPKSPTVCQRSVFSSMRELYTDLALSDSSASLSFFNKAGLLFEIMIGIFSGLTFLLHIVQKSKASGKKSFVGGQEHLNNILSCVVSLQLSSYGSFLRVVGHLHMLDIT